MERRLLIFVCHGQLPVEHSLPQDLGADRRAKIRGSGQQFFVGDYWFSETMREQKYLWSVARFCSPLGCISAIPISKLGGQVFFGCCIPKLRSGINLWIDLGTEFRGTSLNRTRNGVPGYYYEKTTNTQNWAFERRSRLLSRRWLLGFYRKISAQTRLLLQQRVQALSVWEKTGKGVILFQPKSHNSTHCCPFSLFPNLFGQKQWLKHRL